MQGYEVRTCSAAPRFKIVTALLGHDFVFAAGTGRDVHEKSPSGWMGFFLAERVGFEPTVPLPVHLISSQGRYNHFDTAPYVCCSLSIIAGTGSKIKEIFRRFTCV